MSLGIFCHFHRAPQARAALGAPLSAPADMAAAASFPDELGAAAAAIHAPAATGPVAAAAPSAVGASPTAAAGAAGPMGLMPLEIQVAEPQNSCTAIGTPQGFTGRAQVRPNAQPALLAQTAWCLAGRWRLCCCCCSWYCSPAVVSSSRLVPGSNSEVYVERMLVSRRVPG
jgi:hypothetical protein